MYLLPIASFNLKMSIYSYTLYPFFLLSLSPTSLLLQSHSATVKIAKPFDMIYKLLSTDFKPLGTYQIVYDEPFVLMTEIHCTSPWQLIIQSSQFNQVYNCTCIWT